MGPYWDIRGRGPVPDPGRYRPDQDVASARPRPEPPAPRDAWGHFGLDGDGTPGTSGPSTLTGTWRTGIIALPAAGALRGVPVKGSPLAEASHLRRWG